MTVMVVPLGEEISPFHVSHQVVQDIHAEEEDVVA